MKYLSFPLFVFILSSCSGLQGAAHYDSGNGGAVKLRTNILQW